jgi:hypothetical protein
MMVDLTQSNENAVCICCQTVFNYFKFENLIFGYKEDAPICEPCYYAKI